MIPDLARGLADKLSEPIDFDRQRLPFRLHQVLSPPTRHDQILDAAIPQAQGIGRGKLKLTSEQAHATADDEALRRSRLPSTDPEPKVL